MFIFFDSLCVCKMMYLFSPALLECLFHISFLFLLLSAAKLSDAFSEDFQSAFSYCGDMFITENGPVTLDLPITFSVNMTCSLDGKDYVYVFEDNANPPHHIEILGQSNVSVPVTYPENIYIPGQYSMMVTSYISVIDSIRIKVLTRNVSFILTEYLPGNISIFGVLRKYDKLYAPSGETVNISVALHYPTEVEAVSEFSYLWIIGNYQFISSVPYTSYTFEKPAVYNMHVSVVARIPIYNQSGMLQEVKYKWRKFDEEINVKDPFYNINLTGNTYLKHGELFNMSVSCGGSGPFEYCWKILDSYSNETNLTCLSPVITNQCIFPIIYYFHKAGDYEIAIHIDNFVSDMQRNVHIHIYDVLRRAQLSTVIIPLSCSVLVIIIIVAGVMLHVKRSQQINIETADFDFLQSDTCIIETFWERLFRSILNALLIGRHLSRPSYLYLSNTVGESQSRSNSVDSN